MAIAAVLNAITTQVKIRIQETACELFMLHAALEPDALRIELSRPLAAIREAQQAGSTGDSESARVPANSVGTELGKLADLLDRGLLSREEFDQIKAKLIASI